MPLIRHTPTNIFIDISDKALGQTIIKRKAEVVEMTYSPANSRVVVLLRIIPFALGENNTYGDPLSNTDGFQTYYKTITANLTDLVDIETRELLGPSELADDPRNEEEGGPLYGRNYMYEFEYYKVIAETQPVIIDEMIIGKVLQADSIGRL